MTQCMRRDARLVLLLGLLVCGAFGSVACAQPDASASPTVWGGIGPPPTPRPTARPTPRPTAPPTPTPWALPTDGPQDIINNALYTDSVLGDQGCPFTVGPDVNVPLDGPAVWVGWSLSDISVPPWQPAQVMLWEPACIYQTMQAVYHAGVPVRTVTVTYRIQMRDRYGNPQWITGATATLTAPTAARFNWAVLTPEQAWGDYDYASIVPIN